MKPLTVKVFLQSAPVLTEDFEVIEEYTVAKKTYKVNATIQEFKEHYSNYAEENEVIQEEWDMLLMGMELFHILTYNDDDARDFIAYIKSKCN